MKHNPTILSLNISHSLILSKYLRFVFLQIAFVVGAITLLTCSLSAQAIVEEGIYDLQFEEFVAGCGSTNSNYCVRMQIKSASDVENFAIGSYTFYFTYNQNAINNPAYQSINFNDTNICADENAAYMEPAFFADNLTGEANVTAIMELPNQGCPEVSSDWRGIGLVCFEVIDDTETTQLEFGTNFTEVNKNDDTPSHNQGTFSSLDVMPVVVNSPANVDLAPNEPTMVSLCSDEGISLVADIPTLSFGPGVGENPVVGWGISTTDPGDASPLLAEGYSDIVLAGDATTTIATIEGTVEGLDPYGLGVSTLWVSPITFIDYDAETQTFTLDFECFDWGTAVQIDFLANGEEGCPTNCIANVDLSDQTEQSFNLCSDETATLLADVNTLDFGNDAGDNPAVGWAVITGTAVEGNPFEDPNYTGLIAGDVVTTGITIAGTVNGLDPFGFEVSTLSFVPITFINFDSEATPPLFLDQDCFDWGEAVTITFLADGVGDCPAVCDANVEVAEDLELTVPLCVEENYILRVNPTTLDLGVNEGDNPVVGWVISTSNPGDASPFEGEGFTGFAIRGNGEEFTVTVIGTSSGLDPYDIGASALWFTPVTYINFDEGSNNFTLDNNCFDWGESVQIQFLAEGEDACNPQAQCPTTAGDFSASEDVCDGDRPTIPNDETILNSLDDATNAVIVWSRDPSVPLVYEGDGCTPQTVEFTLTILCSDDETVSIEAGTFSVTVYPIPEAPTVVFNDTEVCSYTVVPNCPNDVISPAEVSNQNPGSTDVTESFMVSNGGCAALTFDNIPVPDCPEIVPVCPSSIGDFNDSESICEMGTVNVPTDADILASLDDPTNAVIEWSIDPTVTLVYDGDGCTPQRLDYVLTIRCSDNADIVLNGGTHTVFLYPIPQAPSVVFNNAEICSYIVVPNCPNDVVSPNEVSDQAPGSVNVSQSFTVSNEACFAVAFDDIAIPDCPETAPECPNSVGDFNGSESICEMGLVNVPSDEDILASLDDPGNAIVEWSINPNDPVVYDGDGCNPQQLDYVLTIRCSDNADIVLNGGTHTLFLYPSPQAPTVNLISATEICRYELIPNCENDILDPPTIEDQVAGSGELVQIIKVTNEACTGLSFFDVTIPACPGLCPTSAGVFTTSENLCDGDVPNVTSDETILASVDFADGATIIWSPNPTEPLIYNGDGCNAQAVIYSLTIGCQVDGSVQIDGGTHIVNLYPSPQSPTVDLVENADGFCSYVVLPACENDVVSPSSIEDLAAGSMDIVLPFNVSNEGCSDVLFSEVTVPDCILDDIDPINLPNQLQMEIAPNFLQFGSRSLIEVYLPQSGHTLLEVLDISGRSIKVLHQGELQNGVHEFEWAAEVAASGLYFVRLQTEYG
ncbi:MAG: hypothetical protein ACPGVB_09985, partial [Chitinophagales bacterium]